MGRRPNRARIEEIIRDKDAGQIWFTLFDWLGLAEARRAYCEAFTRPANDKSIDEEIINLFEKAVGGEVPRFKVEVPVDLLLGLILREGFGRGRGRPKPLWQTIADERALERFKRRAHELATPTRGKPRLIAGKARLQAAQEISQKSQLSVPALLDGRPNRPSRPKKRKAEVRHVGQKSRLKPGA
jgi:hypothetical protein